MRKRLLWAAFGTLTVFPLVGWGILSIFKDNSLALMFRSSVSIWIQVLTGIGLGLLLGYGAKYIVSRPFLSDVQRKYSRVIAGLKLKNWHIIFISLCAGFGEELLFRGAVQPLIGVWITAIIFVAIHGYLDPRDWKMSLYGIYMTLAIASLGYYTDYVGVIGASLAHAAIDYVLFKHLIKTGSGQRIYFQEAVEKQPEIISESEVEN